MDYIWLILFVILVIILIRTFNQRRLLENEKNQLVKLVEDGNMLYQQVVDENRGLKEIKQDYKKIQQIEKIVDNLQELNGHKLIELIINVENSKLEAEKPMKNQMSTTKHQKEKHGFGVGIIKKIVNKYQGTVNMEDRGNSFFISIIL